MAANKFVIVGDLNHPPPDPNEQIGITALQGELRWFSASNDDVSVGERLLPAGLYLCFRFGGFQFWVEGKNLADLQVSSEQLAVIVAKLANALALPANN